MEVTNKKNRFRNTAITAGVVLFILKLIANSIIAQIGDPQQVSYYYIYVMVIYFIMLIFLLSLYIQIKDAIKLNQIYGWVGVAFLVIFTITAFQTYEIIPSSIEYSSRFTGGNIGFMGEAVNPGWVAEENATAILSNINLWGLFAIGQFVIFVLGDDFLTNNKFKIKTDADKPLELKSYVSVNDMEIELTQEITFGSGIESNVYLESDFVSECHGVIGKDKGSIYVRDLGSTNHTFINGSKIMPMENYKLKNGDVVTFGNIDVLIIER